MKYLALFLLIGILSCGASPKQDNKESSSANQIKSEKVISELLTVDDFQSKYDELKANESEFNLVDVRTPNEILESGHLEDAININFNSATFKEDMAALDKDVPTLIYCRSGGRSGKTRLMLKGMGFSEVYDLIGGMTEWETSGKPVVTESNK